MTHLEVWARICAAPVVGQVGHRLTQPGGGARPMGHAPAWVTPQGCDLGALHRAHSAHVVVDRRGEHRECAATSARVLKPRRRRQRGARVIQIRRSA